MPFSVLLLTGASSQRHITGKNNNNIAMMQPLKSNEVVLFFDEVDNVKGEIRPALGMMNQKCCDGIIFYRDAVKRQNVICLVEMKHTDLSEAQEQIEQTYDRLSTLLKNECTLCTSHIRQIVWQAYIYRSGAAPKGGYQDIADALKKKGFQQAWVSGDKDITKYLRMEIGADLRHKKSRNRGR